MRNMVKLSLLSKSLSLIPHIALADHALPLTDIRKAVVEHLQVLSMVAKRYCCYCIESKIVSIGGRYMY